DQAPHFGFQATCELEHFCFRLFSRCNLQFEAINRLDHLICSRRETTHALEESQVLGVKFATVIMGHRPNRTDRFTIYIKGNKQSLISKRHRPTQIWITLFPMAE